MPKGFNEQVAERLAILEREMKRLKQPGPAWQDWTPTVDQNGNVAVTVTFAEYTLVDNLVVTVGRLEVTGSGSAGNIIYIEGLPPAIQLSTVNSVIGSALVKDTGTAFYAGVLYTSAAAQWYMLAHGETSAMGIDPSFALANGDRIWFQAAYNRG